MANIEPGASVLARTSSNRMLERIAATPIVGGVDFPVVWVCAPAEWLAAKAEGRAPNTVPWPASAVQLGSKAVA
jgi:hypothetical protein